MAALGLTRDDVAEQFEIEVWPDTEMAIRTFIAMGTQWRTSAVGYTGMDYAALPAVFDLCRVPKRDRTDVFADLRLMEAEFLTACSERKQ